MKFQLKNTIAVLAFTTLFVSCSNDDDSSSVVEGTTGDVELYFDNGVAGDALILGNTYTNSNNESLTINRLNYIVSNIVLIKEDGTEFTYPKEESYFVISEEGDLLTVHLEGVPAGDYTKVKFGIGVDEQRYLQGESEQQSFWDLAAQYNLTWTWSTGYRFINFEGTYTSPAVEGEKTFQVHQGSNSAIDNYREVTLTLPTTARVREDEMPNIHLKTDANVILDGVNKIKLADNINEAQTGTAIMGGENLISIAENTLQMFAVDHVHNGSHTGHGE
ncbi:MbnP family protein [Flavobacterium beibuense]|uniref:Putative lipoprotein n=1 Tax=Flavobacterium beibuense TaxID=657326 RepID=A0A444W8P7_9FLAO|nr:MbnP family protein [Flavobacterium beibuense]RYJ42122.1 putative lipoprotein [Flavobacterium beibuense]